MYIMLNSTLNCLINPLSCDAANGTSTNLKRISFRPYNITVSVLAPNWYLIRLVQLHTRAHPRVRCARGREEVFAHSLRSSSGYLRVPPEIPPRWSRRSSGYQTRPTTNWHRSIARCAYILSYTRVMDTNRARLCHGTKRIPNTSVREPERGSAGQRGRIPRENKFEWRPPLSRPEFYDATYRHVRRKLYNGLVSVRKGALSISRFREEIYAQRA